MSIDTNNLPPFLRVRNCALEMVQSPTGLGEFARCQEKYRLSHVENLELATPKVEMNFGSAIHSVMAVRYREEMKRGEDTELDIIQGWQEQTVLAHFDTHPQPQGEFRDAGRAIDLIRAYNEAYPSHGWRVLGVEEKFEVLVGQIVVPAQCGDTVKISEGIIPEGEPGAGQPYEMVAPRDEPWVIPCYLRGIKDLVVKEHGGIWPVDFKTTKDWNPDLGANRNLLMGKRSFQFRAYAWAETQARRTLAKMNTWMPVETINTHTELPILGTTAVYLVARPPYARQPAKGKETPRNQFHIESYPMEQSVLDEWRADFLHKCEMVMAAWISAKWDRAYEVACGGFGRCPFYDYCDEAPDRREAMLNSSLYQQRSHSMSEVAASNGDQP